MDAEESGPLRRDAYDRLMTSYADNPKIGSPAAIIKAAIREHRLAAEFENMPVHQPSYSLADERVSGDYTDLFRGPVVQCPRCGLDVERTFTGLAHHFGSDGQLCAVGAAPEPLAIEAPKPAVCRGCDRPPRRSCETCWDHRDLEPIINRRQK
jgi:hypothetical protein